MSNPLTFGSLFAGIGGIDLGLERAGMTCRWQVEIDDYATKVLAKHWPNVPKYRDVRSVGADNLSAVDLICGGFPCQDISNAGKRAGITGARSGLWSEYARIVRELRPRYVLVENVAALLGRGLSTVLGDLAALGYDAEWECIPAAAVGAPHIRDRVFIVAYTDCRGRPGSGVCAQQSRRAEVIGPGQAWQGSALADASGARSFSSTQTGIYRRQKGARPRHEQLERYDWWAIEPDVGRVAHGVPARVDRLSGLGNAVVPQVAELIGQWIITFDQEAAHVR